MGRFGSKKGVGMKPWYQQAATEGTALPAPLLRLRRAGRERFEALGFPNASWEDWKYTSVKSLSGGTFQDASATAAPAADRMADFSFLGPDSYRLAFVNGRPAPELSSLEGLPKGVKAGSLIDFLGSDPELVEKYLEKSGELEKNPFASLNAANLAGGTFLWIPKGTVVEKPFEILHLNLTNGHATVTHPRLLLVAEASSQVSLVETYAGEGASPHLTNAVTEIFGGENSVVRHYKLQNESLNSFHIGSVGVRQGRESQYRSYNISLGAALSRHEISSRLDAQGAECILNGLYAVGGRQHVDNQTRIDHATPHCTSTELYKGILDGESQGVFNGTILVRPDAQKTVSRQTNKNLLLSDAAIVNTKPLLEIYANDVKCNHGATIGRLDENQVFYLKSRGIGGKLARDILTYAFAGEVIQDIPLEGLRKRLESRFFEALRLGDIGGKEIA